MKATERTPLLIGALVVTTCFLMSCEPSRKERPDKQADTAPAEKATVPPYAGEFNQEEYQRAKEEALAFAQKVVEERMRNPPTNEIPLPNYEAGPGHPQPPFVNFYTTDDRYPAYLECGYTVEETPYDQSKEPGWFQAALQQIRKLGPKKFPPIEWVAVCIRNGAEHKDASTFEQSFKVGAIFKAAEVFNGSPKASELIAHAEMDRHPFLFDQKQPIPGEQQRWLIVERHAATNHMEMKQE